MIYKIEISEQATRDLKNLWEYIAFALSAPEYAMRQLDRLEARIKGLEQLPGRYPQYGRAAWCKENLHMMPVDNFIVFYILDKSRQVVSIIRILYGGQDIDKEIPSDF